MGVLDTLVHGILDPICNFTSVPDTRNQSETRVGRPSHRAMVDVAYIPWTSTNSQFHRPQG
jgi:hypothetical protein